MNSLKSLCALFLMATSFLSYAQKTNDAPPAATVEPKIIAVVNSANWCGICKANGERFSDNITPYTGKGVAIVVNDLTDEATIAQSKADLKRSSLYKQVYKTNRKGLGRMMQACGIIHGKDKSMASGIVTFIDAKSLKVLNTTSIAVTDTAMKTIIENLLKL